MQPQKQKSARIETLPTLEAVSKTRITRAKSGDFIIDVSGFRLTIGRIAIELSDWQLPISKRPLAVSLPVPNICARFEIGEVQIEEKQATLVLFGLPGFEAKTLVF